MTTSPDTDPNFFDRLATANLETQNCFDMETEGVHENSVNAVSDVIDDPSNTNLDTGRFSPELRRALVELLRSGVVFADSKPQIYELLCRYQTLIEDHLANMYLRLLIDPTAGVALLLQQQNLEGFDDEEESSALISRRTLSLYDTLLLLVLRKHYQERQTAGEQQIIIDIERIESQLTPFLPLTNSSRSDRRKLSGAITKMKEKKLLSSVRGDDERFEITPVVRYVVNAEFLEHLLKEYEAMARSAEKGNVLDESDGV